MNSSVISSPSIHEGFCTPNLPEAVAQGCPCYPGLSLSPRCPSPLSPSAGHTGYFPRFFRRSLDGSSGRFGAKGSSDTGETFPLSCLKPAVVALQERRKERIKEEKHRRKKKNNTGKIFFPLQNTQSFVYPAAPQVEAGWCQGGSFHGCCPPCDSHLLVPHLPTCATIPDGVSSPSSHSTAPEWPRKANPAGIPAK